VRSHRVLRPLVLSLLALGRGLGCGRCDPRPRGDVRQGLGHRRAGLAQPRPGGQGHTLHLSGSVVGGTAAHSNVVIRLAVADLQCART